MPSNHTGAGSAGPRKPPPPLQEGSGRQLVGGGELVSKPEGSAPRASNETRGESK